MGSWVTIGVYGMEISGVSGGCWEFCWNVDALVFKPSPDTFLLMKPFSVVDEIPVVLVFRHRIS